MVKNTDQSTTRRGFLDWILAAFSTITAAAMAIPGLLYLWPAARGGASESVEIEGAADMPIAGSKTIQVGSQVVIVVRQKSGYRAFSAVCTHLGCLVKWDADRKGFLCPCHAAVFDESGRVVSGPPPAPLVAYTVKEVGEKVYVSRS
jgi:cytochrome b6-f complex iron-sulfur subunit